uniref:Uncharacterized protein n=1 Tax=Castor canadensis TaxID=51338 RepID=A0A8C0WAY0_CASCN
LADFILTLGSQFIFFLPDLTDTKIATRPNIVQKFLPCDQPDVKCYLAETNKGSLNVSMMFWFLNVILWGWNAWFVYKETSSNSQSNTLLFHSQGGVPLPARI